MVVGVDTALKVCVVPATPVPATVVVIVSLLKPLLPVKAKAPTPPWLTLLSVNFGKAQAFNTVGARPASSAGVVELTKDILNVEILVTVEGKVTPTGKAAKPDTLKS